MFANGFNEKDIENSQLGFTYGGKQVLRRLLKVCFKVKSLYFYFLNFTCILCIPAGTVSWHTNWYECYIVQRF